ncbi:MAG: GerMN domain-containing protein [Candidatus Abawacabacteria bacterium]|nr:GerMN domain-containing protein [Candidatus Abawacabacteria bacterium]
MKKFSLLALVVLLSSCSIAPMMSPTATPIASCDTATPGTPIMAGCKPMVSPAPTITPVTTVQIALVDASGTATGPSSFGCGDSIVMVNRTVSTTTPLKTAIEELLSVNTYNYGMSGLITALATNSLTVSNVTMIGTMAKVELSGSLTFGGTCDVPRVKEQMDKTIKQFPSVSTYEIWLNGTKHNWDCLFDASTSC